MIVNRYTLCLLVGTICSASIADGFHTGASPLLTQRLQRTRAPVVAGDVPMAPIEHRQSLVIGSTYYGATRPLRMATTGDSGSRGDEVEFVSASDLEAVQALFSRECDADGLMTKATLEAIPAIAEMLGEGDLLREELDDIWDAAPKFPSPAEGGPDRIDVDSFVQCYRDIDDLFEDEEEGGEGGSNGSTSTSASSASQNEAAVQSSSNGDDDEDPVVAGDEADLEVAFKGICDGTSGLVSKEAMKKWDEITSLFADGMLGEDEFERIWEQTAKKPGSNDEIDIEGFLSFNVALDDLFVFDDDELEEDGEGEVEKEGSDEASADDEAANISPVVATDVEMSPKEIFDSICDDDFLVGMDELQRWGELQEMLDDEELLPIELQNMFAETPKAPGTSDKLNESGFTVLYYAIDDLFEEDDGNDSDASDTVAVGTPDATSTQIQDDDSLKEELLDYIAKLSRDPDLLPCGLDSTEREQERLLDIVADLEEQRSNLVITKGGDIQQEDLTGDWDLIFTTSSTMKFNQGLSGLGGSFPNGKFGGVVQKLQASKWTSDIEYKERIEVPAGASFDVTVTGDWKLKGTVNLFTGEPTTVMAIEPDKVKYGPTSTKADHWKALGPLNLLDITYLDDDLRVMRGNTSVNTIFIFRRC